mgnify:CR=1 FL=1
MADLPDLSRIEGFDWERHRVAFYECEEAFFHDPVLAPDFGHSGAEQRYFAFGCTVRRRLLTIVFTMRKNKICVVSARDMNRKERKKYHETL